MFSVTKLLLLFHLKAKVFVQPTQCFNCVGKSNIMLVQQMVRYSILCTQIMILKPKISKGKPDEPMRPWRRWVRHEVVIKHSGQPLADAQKHSHGDRQREEHRWLHRQPSRQQPPWVVPCEAVRSPALLVVVHAMGREQIESLGLLICWKWQRFFHALHMHAPTPHDSTRE